MPGLVTVTSAPPSSRLTTVANARVECDIQDASADAKLGLLIDRATGIIESLCGTRFGRQTVTETFRFSWDSGQGPFAQQTAPYGTPLNSQRKPIILTSRLAMSVASVAELDTTLTSGTDYEVDPGAGMIYRLRSGYRAWWNSTIVTVVYSTGFVLPNDNGTRDLPFEIEDACLALVRSGYFAQGRDPSVSIDTLNGDRTAYWERTGSPMAIDDALNNQLTDYIVRAW